jgi:hypothetical protein
VFGVGIGTAREWRLVNNELVVDAFETVVDMGTPPVADGVGCCDIPCACDVWVNPSGAVVMSSMKLKPDVGFVGGILEERVEKLVVGFGGLVMLLSLRNSR